MGAKKREGFTNQIEQAERSFAVAAARLLWWLELSVFESELGKTKNSKASQSRLSIRGRAWPQQQGACRAMDETECNTDWALARRQGHSVSVWSRS